MWIHMKTIIKTFWLVALVALTGCAAPTPSSPSPKPEVPQMPSYVPITFELNNKTYQFPLKYEQLVNDGWAPTTALDTVMIEGNTFIPNYFMRKKETIFRVSLYNPTKESIAAKDAYVSEVAFENRTFKQDVAPVIRVYDFLNFETKLSELKEKYGEGSDKSDAIFESYLFDLDARNSIKVDVYKDRRDGEVSRWIILQSYDKN